MKYFDYNIDINTDKIVFDSELKLPLDELEWLDSQQFRLKVNEDGSAELIAVKED